MSIQSPEECDIPVGWYELVKSMLTTTKCMYPSVVFIQVKEKFGSLRCHFNVLDEAEDFVYGAVSDYIEAYERESMTTCVVCGSVHTTRMSYQNGWVSPYCDLHTPRGL